MSEGSLYFPLTRHIRCIYAALLHGLPLCSGFRTQDYSKIVLHAFQEPIIEVANAYTKRIIRVEADTVFPFLAKGKRINNIHQIPPELQKTYLHMIATYKTKHFTSK